MTARYYLVFSIFLFSCSEAVNTKSQSKKYYVFIEQEKQSVSGEWKNETVLDSIQAISDSAAYLEGAISYKIRLETPKLHKQAGIKSWFRAKSFKVLNEVGEDIRNNVSSNVIRKGQWLIDQQELP